MKKIPYTDKNDGLLHHTTGSFAGWTPSENGKLLYAMFVFKDRIGYIEKSCFSEETIQQLDASLPAQEAQS